MSPTFQQWICLDEPLNKQKWQRRNKITKDVRVILTGWIKKYNVPFQGFSNKKNARENFMTSDEAVNNDKNYNGNVRSNWQTAVICYLTFYACFSISPHDSLSRGSTVGVEFNIITKINQPKGFHLCQT